MNETTPPTTPGQGPEPEPDATSGPAPSPGEHGTSAHGTSAHGGSEHGGSEPAPGEPPAATTSAAAAGATEAGRTASGTTGQSPGQTPGQTPGQAGPTPGQAGPTPGPTPAGPSAGPGAGPADGGGFFGTVRRLGITRSDDRWVGGVCAGVADRLGIDPLIVRGAMVVTALLSGVGAVAYALAWALLPERRDGRIHAEELFAGRFDVAVVGQAALLVVGLSRGDGWWGVAGPPWAHHVSGAISGLLWFAFVVGSLVAVAVLVSRHRTPGGAAPGAGPGPGTPYGTPGSSAPPRPTTPYGPGSPYASASSAAYASTASTPYASSGPAYGTPTYGTAPMPAYTPPAAAYTPPAAYAPRPVPPPAPTRPAPPRRRGPGATSIGIVVALSLLTLAGLLAASRTGAFDGPVLLTTLGVTAVLAGIGVVVAGLRGRTSGSLGFLAVVALIVSLPAGVTTHREWAWDGSGIHRADEPVIVTSRLAAADGLHFGAGEAVYDLSEVPLTDEPLLVPISVGAGRVDIVVPQDAAVEASVRVGLGSVSWEVDDDHESASGVRMDGTVFRDDASEADGPQLSLDVSVGAGKVTITREDS